MKESNPGGGFEPKPLHPNEPNKPSEQLGQPPSGGFPYPNWMLGVPGEIQSIRIENLKPSDLAGFSFERESKPLLEDLQNLDSSSLERMGYKNVTEYLLDRILVLAAVIELHRSPLSYTEAMDVPEIALTPEILDIRLKYHGIDLARRFLLKRWKEKGLM